MQVDVKNIEGQVVRTIELPESIYNVEVSDHVLHLVVKAYRANRRQGTHATKTRSLVSGGGKKPFRQKGTGNARQGTSRAPHMPGGAVVHGPQPRDYSEKVNQRVKKLALRMALSDKLRHKKLIVLDDFALSSYSTKHIVKTLGNLELQSALLSDERKDDLLFRSVRNIKGAASIPTAELNAESVLSYDSLVICEKALTTLNQRLGD